MSQIGSVDAMWTWKLSTLPEETGTVVIRIYSNGTPTQTSIEGIAPRETPQFLLENADRNVHLLLPANSGYVVQSDFLERRMVDCPDVTKVQSFVSPGQQIKGCTAETYQSMGFSDLLSRSYGAIAASTSATINDELVKRLSFNWLSFF